MRPEYEMLTVRPFTGVLQSISGLTPITGLPFSSQAHKQSSQAEAGEGEKKCFCDVHKDKEEFITSFLSF